MGVSQGRNFEMSSIFIIDSLYQLEHKSRYGDEADSSDLEIAALVAHGAARVREKNNVSRKREVLWSDWSEGQPAV